MARVGGGIGPVLERENPLLSFQLDPGEPGFLRQARATESTELIHAQELRNRTRLTRQVLQEGRQVVFSDVELHFRVAGDVLTATSGKTTVVSRPPPAPAIAEGLSSRSALPLPGGDALPLAGMGSPESSPGPATLAEFPGDSLLAASPGEERRADSPAPLTTRLGARMRGGTIEQVPPTVGTRVDILA